MLIVVMGSPGSGKTTLAYILQHELPNSQVISCGDLYRHNDTNHDLQRAREHGRSAWIAELQKFIIIALQKEMQKYVGQTIIIDGLWADNLRSFQELGTIDKLYYVKCTKDEAIERLIKRNRIDDYPERIIKRVNSYFEREQYTLDQIRKLRIDMDFV